MNVRTEITRLRTEVERFKGVADEDAIAPSDLMRAAGLQPDTWQKDLLENTSKRTLLLVTRQGGKSTTTAAKALHKALYTPASLVLLLSPSLRQSQELFNKVVGIYRAAGEPMALENLSALRMEMVHGSRIIALPGTEKTIRGYSGVDLLIIDEASRVLDELYYSVRPMLAVSGGELISLTTPWGKRGFFYKEWTNGANDWKRIRVTANDCPRISAAFLEEEQLKMPDAWYRSEYMCEFTDTVDSVFKTEDIHSAVTSEIKPLFVL